MKKILLFFVFYSLLIANAQVVTLEHKYYTDFYDTVMKAPVYTMYTLSKSHLKKVVKRGSTFYRDPLVSQASQGNNSLYKGNKLYDKGHLSPAADFCFGKLAYKESMFYTNTAPQQKYFNEHLWQAVEEATRDTCRKYGNVTVYTGCLYANKKFNGLQVPTHYWKVIIYNHGKRAGWLAENKKPKSNKANTVQDDVADIEAKTELRFEAE